MTASSPLFRASIRFGSSRHHVFHAYWRPTFTYDADSDSFVRTPRSAESIRRKKKSGCTHLETRTNWTLSDLQKISAEVKEAACELNDFVIWANTLVTKTKLFPGEDY